MSLIDKTTYEEASSIAIESIMAGMSLSESEKRKLMKEMARENAKEEKPRRMAEQRNHSMLQALLAGKVKPVLTYKDPEHTPLSFNVLEHKALMYQWSEEIDYDPLEAKLQHLSAWMRDIYCGDFNAFMNHIDGLSMEEVEKKLKLRESMMFRSAIFHVVLGAQRVDAAVKSGIVSKGHIRVLQKILNLGAEVNTWDVSGKTPLHYATTREKTNKTQLLMTRIFLESGANPNFLNRFGDGPLNGCMETNDEESAKLLLDFGADPTIRNTDGMCPLVMANQTKSNMKALFTVQRKAKKEGKLVVQEKLKKCENCLFPAEKRCSGCCLVWYCSGECQKEHWKKHKESCKARRNGYLKLGMVVWQQMIFVFSSSSSNLVLRIRLPTSEDNPIILLLVNNKDMSMRGQVTDYKDPNGDIIKEAIKTKGHGGQYGFFNCILNGGELSVHPTVLPQADW